MLNQYKFNNVIFPIWLLWLIPTVWIIIIPGNFIIDSLVLIISMKLFKIVCKKEFYKKHIFKIFIFGMISDIIGSLFIFLLLNIFENIIDLGITGDELLITAPGLILASILIFILNYFITFRKLEKRLRFKFSLIFAIVTAPYTFLIPTSWIY